ncbi:hypothetical protein SynMITS9220_02950 [Synechococcus sp. MIT S9220]|nr:hypothetical protein SynMITS9220_02950 [Synechococcus sp. MIT S9220]
MSDLKGVALNGLCGCCIRSPCVSFYRKLITIRIFDVQ